MKGIGAAQVKSMGQGSLKDIGKLENINRYYKPGDIGEMQLFLGPNADSLSDVQQAAVELEENLRKQGMKPWPGRSKIVVVDWNARAVRLLFEATAVKGVNGPAQQGVGIIPVIAVGGVMGAMMLASKIAFGISALIIVLNTIPGITVPSRITKIADAVLLITSMGAAYKILRNAKLLRFLPGGAKVWLFGSGLLIFVLLKPGLAWKALKYVTEKAADVLPDIPWTRLAIAGVCIGGLVGFTMLRKK
jgi:hypothetical protein